MNFPKRLLMGFAGAGLMAAILIPVAPRAARAVVATLVQVANTPSNPAITLDASKSASQHVTLLCQAHFDACITGAYTFSSSTPFTVPAGQNLMVNSIDIITFAGGGTNTFTLQIPPGAFFFPQNGTFGAYYREWVVPGDGTTHSFQYPNGFPFPPGWTFNGPNNVGLITTDGSNGFIAYIDGYLTAN